VSTVVIASSGGCPPVEDRVLSHNEELVVVEPFFMEFRPVRDPVDIPGVVIPDLVLAIWFPFSAEFSSGVDNVYPVAFFGLEDVFDVGSFHAREVFIEVEYSLHGISSPSSSLEVDDTGEHTLFTVVFSVLHGGVPVLSTVIEPVVTIVGPINVVEVVIRIEVQTVPSIGISSPHYGASVSVQNIFNFDWAILPPLADRYGVTFA